MAIWQYPKTSGQAEIISELFENHINNMDATLLIGRYIGDDRFFNKIEKELKEKKYNEDARVHLLEILMIWVETPNFLNTYAKPIIEKTINEQLEIQKLKELVISNKIN